MFLKKAIEFNLPKGTLALTFDDGPGPRTLGIARYLHEQGIRATFFVIGKQIRKYPGVIQKLKTLGHCIGNHTYTHPDMPLQSAPQELIDDVLKTHHLIQAAISPAKLIMRPPFGSWTPQVAETLNSHPDLAAYRGPVCWDIDKNDYSIGSHRMLDPDQPMYTFEACCKDYLDEIRAKQSGVILLHDWIAYKNVKSWVLRWRNRTPALTRWLIPQIRDFKFVTIDEVLPE